MTATHITAPDGSLWQLVPVEPTEEMCAAGAKAAHDGDGLSAKQFYPTVYGVMLDSAPEFGGVAVGIPDVPFDTTRKVVRALTRLGVSTPCSQEEQAARAVELVNLLCREILNAPHPPAADEASA